MVQVNLSQIKNPALLAKANGLLSKQNLAFEAFKQVLNQQPASWASNYGYQPGENPSVFTVANEIEGTPGANAGTQSPKASGEGQNVGQTNSADQNQPTGQFTIKGPGSGTETTSSSVRPGERGDNQGKRQDFTQTQQDYVQKQQQARQVYNSSSDILQSFVASITTNADAFVEDFSTSFANANGVFGDMAANGTTQTGGASDVAATGETSSTEGTTDDETVENKDENPTVTVDQNDASDPTKVDTAYEDPSKQETPEDKSPAAQVMNDINQMLAEQQKELAQKQQEQAEQQVEEAEHAMG